ncbi:MAG: endonuclease III [Dehalococcoidia bacterium]|nr:endonuclease III [Dehalococcoidia bacterium]
MQEQERDRIQPAQILMRLTRIYGPFESRPHGDPITELVLTILSQNTSDTNSGRAFMRLKQRFPTWDELAAADEAEVEQAIAAGGLAKQKAPRIIATLREIVNRQGSLDLSHLAEPRLRVEKAREWLMSLRGVGPKTAACVLLFALGKRALPVDTHVHRVSARLGLIPPGMNAAKAHAALEAIVPDRLFYAFHIALIKHGRRLCRASRPHCQQCPLLAGCPEGERRLISGDYASAQLSEAFSDA